MSNVTVAGLTVTQVATGGTIVDDLDLQVAAGEVLGVVGESGSGKTTLGLALLGYARPGARITRGSVTVDQVAIPLDDESGARALRGRLVAYVPQDPSASLNPALRVGRQLRDVVVRHAPEADADERVAAVLERVGLPHDHAFGRRYPHQLSGGQQQRVAIAAAVACEPALVVLDEPTTGLDVVTQQRILEEVDRLRRETGTAMVYVSHDLAVVASIADRVAVMYAGRIVETAPTAELLGRPLHPYTRGLVCAAPDHVEPRRLVGISGVAPSVSERPSGCAFRTRCTQVTDLCTQAVPALQRLGAPHPVACVHFERTPRPAFVALSPRTEPDRSAPLLELRELGAEHRTRGDVVVAAAAVDLAVADGQIVALVGESGSGKTTIARCVAGLHPIASGAVLLDGQPLAGSVRRRSREQRQAIQLVFQNPNQSLNPRERIGTAIARAGCFLRDLSRAEGADDARRLLGLVRLPAATFDRFPRELSGGERQRAAIARALAAGPRVLVCDEITSALDASVQAAVLDLLLGLRDELGLALLFITHDLGVVASVADEVAVLDGGAIVEQGTTTRVLGEAEHTYTRRLVDAAPRLPDDGHAPVGVR